MHTVEANGIELCYETFGQGEPLLLIMGIGAQMVLWDDDFCEALAREGFRVIRFDNRDVGKSTRFDHLGVPNIRRALARWVVGMPVETAYRLEDMADDAAGLLDALSIDRAHVVGLSMGGMIAQTMAIRHPLRLCTLTSIMSHPGDRLSCIPRPHAFRALLGRAPQSELEAQNNMLDFFRVVGTPGHQDEASIRRKASRCYARGLSPKGFLRQMTAIMTAPDRRPFLAAFAAPTLVMHGNRDPLIPIRGGRRTAAAIPNARWVEIGGMGHDLPRRYWPTMIREIRQIAGAQSSAS